MRTRISTSVWPQVKPLTRSDRAICLTDHEKIVLSSAAFDRRKQGKAPVERQGEPNQSLRFLVPIPKPCLQLVLRLTVETCHPKCWGVNLWLSSYPHGRVRQVVGDADGVVLVRGSQSRSGVEWRDLCCNRMTPYPQAVVEFHAMPRGPTRVDGLCQLSLCGTRRIFPLASGGHCKPAIGCISPSSSLSSLDSGPDAFMPRSRFPLFTRSSNSGAWTDRSICGIPGEECGAPRTTSGGANGT